MSDEFTKHERGTPSKDIRFNHRHETNPRLLDDTRWTAPRMVKTKPPCTQQTPAPAFRQAQYRHADFDVVSTYRASVTLQCQWCGHRWKEPR